MTLELFDSHLSRRDFISRSMLAGSYLLVFSDIQALAGEIRSSAPAFFSQQERIVLARACDRIFRGADKLGVVNYIEQLLTAFDSNPPRIYAAGPFSNRGGGIGSKNGFEDFLPLTRAQTLSWQTRLYGPTAALGWSNNPYVEEEFRLYSLRDLIRFGIHCLPEFENSPAHLDSLGQLPPLESAEFRDRRFLELNFFALQTRYIRELTKLTLQGCFSAPEYGGNKDLAGWRLIQFPGDNCPTGNSHFDPQTGNYSPSSLAALALPDQSPDTAPLGGWIDTYLSLINIALKTGLM